MNVPRMPGNQVRLRDSTDRRVLPDSPIRAVGAEAELARLPLGDPLRVVVAARDTRVELVLRDRQLVLAKGGLPQQVVEYPEDGVEVPLQAGETDLGGVDVGRGLDLGRARFQKVIELVARLRLRATG